MKLVEYKVIDFINEVDSPSPAPGGGSVSALASSLGAALCRMVGHLTIGKKKYKELDNNVKHTFESAFTTIEKLQHEITTLIDEDTENFNLVMKALKLPKETHDEQITRANSIEEATIKATQTPFRMVEISIEILRLLNIFLEYGNKNALSDIGVAALLTLAGLKGAILNVKINLPSITNTNLVEELKSKCDKYYSEAISISESIENKVLNYLN